MVKYVQDKKTGRLLGSIGEGKNHVPTPATSTPKTQQAVAQTGRLLSNTGRVGPAQTSFPYKGYQLEAASNEDNKTIYIEIHSYTNPAGRKIILKEALALTNFKPEELPDSFDKLQAEAIAYIESEAGSEEWLAEEFKMALEYSGEYTPRSPISPTP